MASDISLNPTQAISPLSNGKSLPPQQERTAPKVDRAVKEGSTSAEDRVSLSPQLQQALTETEKEERKKQDAAPANKEEISNRSAAKVEFVYDLNGDLITKYLDTSNRLVYQSPSEMTLFLREADSKSKSKTVVNTTA